MEGHLKLDRVAAAETPPHRSQGFSACITVCESSWSGDEAAGGGPDILWTPQHSLHSLLHDPCASLYKEDRFLYYNTLCPEGLSCISQGALVCVLGRGDLVSRYTSTGSEFIFSSKQDDPR